MAFAALEMAGKEDRVRLIWMRQLVPILHRLSLNVIREICLYLQIWPLLTWVSPQSISFFDFQNMCLGAAIPLERCITTLNASWVTVDEDKVVICEGGSNGEIHSDNVLHTALQLHRSGRVKVLSDMKHPHNNPGMVMWAGFVHVFGSFVGPGETKCERLLLTQSAWEQLPDLHSRRSLFTPVVWRNEIYLCGGYQNSTVEVFDGATMRLLDINLLEAGSALACIKEDELLVITPRFLITIAKKESGLVLGTAKRDNVHPSIYTTPVLWGDLVINLDTSGPCNYCIK